MRTCGSDACFKLASVNVERRPQGIDIPWPTVIGPIVADFSPHNVKATDGGVLRVRRPDRESYVGCSAAFMAGEV